MQTTAGDLTTGTVIRVRRHDNYVGDVFIPDSEGAEVRTVKLVKASMFRGKGIVIEYVEGSMSFALPPSTAVTVIN